MSESLMSKRRLQARQREDQAVSARLNGYTYQAIADLLDVTKAAAYKMVARSMGRTKASADEGADLLRSIELARLDKMYTNMFALATKGSMGAVDRCLRIMERRAKLLGLDAAEKQEQRSVRKVIIEYADTARSDNQTSPIAQSAVKSETGEEEI
jgi:hypothetical protein